METFGYVPDYRIETQNLMSQENFVKALKRLQAWGGLPQTGIIDYRTEQLMMKPRCGVKDRYHEDIGRRRRKRYILATSKWQKIDLTFRYVIVNDLDPRLSTLGFPLGSNFLLINTGK